MIEVYALIAALGLAAVHLFSNKLRILGAVPRHPLLSVASGTAVAFVIMQLLPGISQGQQAIANATQQGALGFLDRHAYLIMLISLIIFYTMEKLARVSKDKQQKENNKEQASAKVFWLHMATFGIMNVLIGYLLINRHETLQALALFFAAMLVKFIVNDHGLHNAHKDAYDHLGRWLLAGAVLVGWITGYFMTLPNIGPAVLQAFLAGGVLLNVLKEELPAEKKAKIVPFASGALIYAVLLLSL